MAADASATDRQCLRCACGSNRKLRCRNRAVYDAYDAMDGSAPSSTERRRRDWVARLYRGVRWYFEGLLTPWLEMPGMVSDESQAIVCLSEAEPPALLPSSHAER
jgi:hypothetical protein